MNEQDYQKLIKIEDKLYGYANEFGLRFHDIEWDVIPDQKMFEIIRVGISLGRVASYFQSLHAILFIPEKGSIGG